jgi:short-subunit dehydrogenase
VADRELHGLRALVTGASKGIGHAVVSIARSRMRVAQTLAEHLQRDHRLSKTDVGVDAIHWIEASSPRRGA